MTPADENPAHDSFWLIHKNKNNNRFKAIVDASELLVTKKSN